MGRKWDEYKAKEGDHWIARVHAALDDPDWRESGSVEFHILRGLTKGIMAGNITIGNPYYLKIAQGAGIYIDTGYQYDQLQQELWELARIGLFTAGKLGGVAATSPENPAPDPSSPENDPKVWAPTLERRIDDMAADRFAGLAILRGLCAGISNGTVRYGSTAYCDLLLATVADDYFDSVPPNCEILAALTEHGLFSDELLRGCIPDRSTAISRLK